MNSNEYERKKMLTADEHGSLMLQLSSLTTRFPITQINYYFDDIYFTLHNRSETLRIRQIEKNLTLEHKYNKRYIDGIRVCDELKKTVDWLPQQIVIKNTKYFYIGNMTTERMNFIFDNATFSLDKSMYLGVIDYELEVEADSREQMINQIDLGISFEQIPYGKYTRFMNRFMEMRSEFDNVCF